MTSKEKLLAAKTQQKRQEDEEILFRSTKEKCAPKKKDVPVFKSKQFNAQASLLVKSEPGAKTMDASKIVLVSRDEFSRTNLVHESSIKRYDEIKNELKRVFQRDKELTAAQQALPKSPIQTLS